MYPLCALFLHLCPGSNAAANFAIFFVLAKNRKNRKASCKFCKICENCYLRFFVVFCHVNVCHSSRTQLQIFLNLRKLQGRRFFALLAIFRNSLSYALVPCPSVNQPRVTSLTVSFRSVHSPALNFWAWGTCARFSISHFENYQTVTGGYPFFFFFVLFYQKAGTRQYVGIVNTRALKSLTFCSLNFVFFHFLFFQSLLSRMESYYFFKFLLFFEFDNVFFPRDYEFLSIIHYKNYITQKKIENLDYRKQWYPTTAFLKCFKNLF